MSTKITTNVSGAWVSAIPLHSDRKYSDLPDPEVPITTEWNPKPPKSLARSVMCWISPSGRTPTGTIAHRGSPRRSEERRVGKEGRERPSPEDEKLKKIEIRTVDDCNKQEETELDNALTHQ